jgi:hypothetical protein
MLSPPLWRASSWRSLPPPRGRAPTPLPRRLRWTAYPRPPPSSTASTTSTRGEPNTDRPLPVGSRKAAECRRAGSRKATHAIAVDREEGVENGLTCAVVVTGAAAASIAHSAGGRAALAARAAGAATAPISGAGLIVRTARVAVGSPLHSSHVVLQARGRSRWQGGEKWKGQQED